MKKKLKYLLLLLLLCGVSVVSAMLITSLSIDGIGKLGKNTWDVSFDNIVVSDGSVDGSASINNRLGISFSANLMQPGDFYEFKVDVVNNGTIDAMVNKFELSDISEYDELIKYTVSYEDGMEISKKDKLAIMESDTFLIRIEYRKDINSSNLNNDDIDLSFGFNIDYVQDDGSGVERLSSLVGTLVKGAISSDNIIFNKAVTKEENGIYKIDDTYFFRGGVINNNVVIDDTCYYALRTTTLGDLKLLYNGKYVDGSCRSDDVFIDTTKFDEESNQINYDNSDIRVFLNEWYEENLIKYDKAIVSGYCNDLSKKDDKYYNFLKFEKGLMDLSCDSTLNDKIALLSIDDILLSGYGRSGTNKAFIDASSPYYSMSTYSDSKVIIINEYGAKDTSVVTAELGVRPVITIKGNTGILDGDGTKDKPYIASLKV